MLDLDALERMEKDATKAPWFLVGKPWVSDDQCDTYAVAGNPDPHVGIEVLQWVEVDEVTADDDHGLVMARDMAEAVQRNNLALSVALRNAAPTLIARARLAERMAEALDAVRVSIELDMDIDGLSDEEIVKRMNFAERAGAPKWKRTRAALMLRGLLREWDALNETGGTE